MDVMTGRPRVLIAEDDRLIAELMHDVLEEDFRVETASNGLDAVSKARRRRPDVVLMDAEMPEMDGYEACRALRRRPETAGVPIIFVTAKTHPVAINKAFEAGATDYLPKPFSIAQLRARAHTWLMRGAR